MPCNPQFSIIKESKYLGRGQMLGKIFGTFGLFWMKRHHWTSLKVLQEGVKANLSLFFINETIIHSHWGVLSGEGTEG